MNCPYIPTWTLSHQSFNRISGIAVRHFGALAAVWIHDLNNDVYFQIGLVTLLGLAAKNTILILKYALLRKAEDYTACAAAMEVACWQQPSLQSFSFHCSTGRLHEAHPQQSH